MEKKVSQARIDRIKRFLPAMLAEFEKEEKQDTGLATPMPYIMKSSSKTSKKEEDTEEIEEK